VISAITPQMPQSVTMKMRAALILCRMFPFRFPFAFFC
jgi:hypothetical protein